MQKFILLHFDYSLNMMCVKISPSHKRWRNKAVIIFFYKKLFIVLFRLKLNPFSRKSTEKKKSTFKGTETAKDTDADSSSLSENQKVQFKIERKKIHNAFLKVLFDYRIRERKMLKKSSNPKYPEKKK